MQTELTERQRSVVQGLADGKTVKEIAIALGLSHHTINLHVVNAKKKANVNKETALVAVAIRKGWVQ